MEYGIFVDKDGNTHNGLSAPRKLNEAKLKIKGINFLVFLRNNSERKNLNKKYGSMISGFFICSK